MKVRLSCRRVYPPRSDNLRKRITHADGRASRRDELVKCAVTVGDDVVLHFHGFHDANGLAARDHLSLGNQHPDQCAVKRAT